MVTGSKISPEDEMSNISFLGYHMWFKNTITVMFPWGLTTWLRYVTVITNHNNPNNALSSQRGRRIPKGVAVENPTCQEIGDVVKSLGLRHEIQPKKHYTRELDRERWQLGRVITPQILISDLAALFQMCYRFSVIVNFIDANWDSTLLSNIMEELPLRYIYIIQLLMLRGYWLL